MGRKGNLLFVISEDSIVHSAHPMCFPLSIPIVQTLCCIIDPRRATTVDIVGCLEEKVIEHYSVERSAFFFEMAGKPLNKTLTSCDGHTFNNGTTIFVQFRNRGGCFMVSLTLTMIIFLLIISSTCTCGTSLLLVPLLLPFLFVLPLFCL